MNGASLSHEIRLEKLISVKHQIRRRCWTEICRKVDGRDQKKAQTTKEEALLLSYPYTSTCFQLFIQEPADRG
jgi:hypothetical protein